ncbi:MAG: ribose-phosphate pyrophosphokinase [Deltaproteobacteria bacterium]|jgi:ribose-phosphate pyrophosphokinase|nr:ribose-phosphate pyrophosphokinase [Deltaproteobacteria bacterium]
MSSEIVLISGNSNVSLAADICGCLWQPLGLAQVRRFSDGEILVEIGENVRGRDAFVIQSTCHPVNDNLMELLLIIDALKRASARRITAVIPYYGYARQDRKATPRVPISAKLVADLLTAAGTSRVLAMDLHAGQIQGFFNIPVDHLFAAPEVLKDIKDNYDLDNVILVSPDAGGVERTRYLAKRLSAPLAVVDKRREAPNVAKAMSIIGEVKGRRAIIVDDMIDTAGTLTQAANFVLSMGAIDVAAYATHAVFSGKAIDLINDSALSQVVVTNTIPLPVNRDVSKIKVLSVASLLSEAIRRIHQEDSISSLFV